MQERTGRPLPLLWALGGLLLLVPVADAGEPSGGVATFQGTCELSGTVRHEPPLTTTAQPGRAFATADGLCSGVLTEGDGDVEQLVDQPATYLVRAEGELSCGGGRSEGGGSLRLSGERIDFLFSEVRGPGAAAIALEGEAGGGATGAAAVSTTEDPADIASRCLSRGLRSVDVDISLVSPGISG